MPDKPILDYANPGMTTSPYWTALMVLPEFAFGIFAGAVTRVMFLAYTSSNAQHEMRPFLLRTAFVAILLTAVACPTVWATRVMAEIRQPRRNRSFRTKAAIGFSYVWAVQFATAGLMWMLFQNGVEIDSTLLIAGPVALMVLLAVVAGLILSPR